MWNINQNYPDESMRHWLNESMRNTTSIYNSDIFEPRYPAIKNTDQYNKFLQVFFFFSTYHWGSHYFFAKSVTDRDKVKIFFSLLKNIYWTFILACRNAPRKGRVKKEHLWLYKDNLQFHGTLTLSELSPLIIPACS